MTESRATFIGLVGLYALNLHCVSCLCALSDIAGIKLIIVGVADLGSKKSE